MKEVCAVIQEYIKRNNIKGITIGEVRGKPVALHNHLDSFEVRALEVSEDVGLVIGGLVVTEKVINNQWKTLDRNIEEHNRKIKNKLNHIRVVKILVADENNMIDRLI